jgi:antagonist of KipI
MDWYAHRAANMLVGNPADAATVEAGLADHAYQLTEAGLIAVTGAGFDLCVQSRPLPRWTALFIQAGWTIELRKNSEGSWAYLAVAGGLQTTVVLGSRSAYLRGGFAGLVGRPLQTGDVLSTGTGPPAPLSLAGRSIPTARRPDYNQAPTLDVLLGPQAEAFTPEGIETCLSAQYTVSAVSDRMGYRLEGPAIAHQASADIISDGLALGAIQVPASGQPLVMMSDRPTTGGYPKIATLATADVPLLAQCRPGTSLIKFRAVAVEAAQARYRQLRYTLDKSVQEPESDWSGF